MIMIEKTISKNEVYKGSVLRFEVDTVELEDGTVATRELVRHPGGVGVVAIDSDGMVYMVEQFRKPYEEVILEIPAGKLDPGEAPEVCGLRELKEETGLVASELISPGMFYPSVGYTDERLHLFLAKDFTCGEASPDEDEFVDVKKVHINDLVAGVMSGSIKDGKTIAAILKTKMYMNI